MYGVSYMYLYSYLQGERKGEEQHTVYSMMDDPFE